MSFEEPHYLHYAWLLPILAAGSLLSRYLTARAHAELVPPGRNQLRPLLQLALRLLAVAALVLALANPYRGKFPHPAGPRGATKLVFAIDVSRSMLAGDVLPDRLSQAKKVVAEVVRGLHGQEASLVVFAGNAQLYMPLTTDYEALSRAAAALTPDLVPRQGTSLFQALALAARVFGGPSLQPRIICVLSDGESHTLRYEGLADSLSKAGINLFAVGIGTPEGANIPVPDQNGGALTIKRNQEGQPVLSQLQENQLKRVVKGRPGHYIRLNTWRNASARLLDEIGKFEPASAQAPGADKGPVEYFQLCLLAAFCLLLVEFTVPSGKQM